MERIVVLNSGGFDSVCLCHLIREEHPEAEIHSIHFEYGNRNRFMENHCAKKVCKKLNMIHHRIKLQPFKWSKSTLFKGNSSDTYDGQYLEYRNLIFLSYAASLAESVGSKSIYMAVIKGITGHTYIDCTVKFFNLMNKVLSDSSISIKTPFIEMDKADFKDIAVSNHITSHDYFSCNEPIMGFLSCGRCPDCTALENISFKEK